MIHASFNKHEVMRYLEPQTLRGLQNTRITTFRKTARHLIRDRHTVKRKVRMTLHYYGAMCLDRHSFIASNRVSTFRHSGNLIDGVLTYNSALCKEWEQKDLYGY